jgi:hypothetical protein
MIRRFAGPALAALLVAGCLDSPAPSASPTPTPRPDPTPSITSRNLGLTAVYEGLLVHVDRATSEVALRSSTVEVAIRLENRGAEESQLDAPIRLVTNGQTFEATRESRVPSVTPGGLAPALMTFELPEITNLDDAVLQIGADADHKALIPLADGGGAPVLLEPVELDVSGRASAGTLRITLTGATLRWDLPDWSQELPSTTRALILTYDVTFTGEFGGGFAFTGDNVALRLPNTAILEHRADGRSQSIELVAAGGTKTGLFSRFEIPADLTGTYRLLVKNGQSEGAIAFTIGG